MLERVLVSGSLELLARCLREEARPAGPDVVVVTTPAAFTGEAAAALAVAGALEGADLTVEALMAPDRAAAQEPYFARRVLESDVAVLVDGAALHARSVWRATPLGEALREARYLAAVGAGASVLGTHMVDPRGGAPTTGLGIVDGLVIGVAAPPDQLTRTRQLLGSTAPLAMLGPGSAVLWEVGRWRVLRPEGLEVTLGDEALTLD